MVKCAKCKNFTPSSRKCDGYKTTIKPKHVDKQLPCSKYKRRARAKYKIRKNEGFTEAQCPVCGFWIWIGEHPENLVEIKHLRSPTLKRESYHKLVFKEATLDQYGCPYLPEHYPLLKIPTEKQCLANALHAQNVWKAEQILKNAHAIKPLARIKEM